MPQLHILFILFHSLAYASEDGTPPWMLSADSVQ